MPLYGQTLITGSEQETAKKHGEINENEETRPNHKGTMYETKNPTTTEGKNEVIIAQKNKQ